MDKATFIARLNDLVTLARKDVGQDALLFFSASKEPYDPRTDSQDYELTETDQLWDWLKDAEGEWYIDVYQSHPEINTAYYIDYTLWND